MSWKSLKISRFNYIYLPMPLKRLISDVLHLTNNDQVVCIAADSRDALSFLRTGLGYLGGSAIIYLISKSVNLMRQIQDLLLNSVS